MSFRPEYSKILKQIQGDLKNGSAEEKERAKLLIKKATYVLLDPENPNTYKKNFIDDYRAVKVGQRYRLFYKIYYEHKIVYFAWINGDDNIHTTGDVDDCYPEFERLYNNGSIDQYVHVEETGSIYKKNTDWGASRIYVSYISRLSTGDEYQANCDLTLAKINELEYRIISISVTEEGRGLASNLLKNLTFEADSVKVKLYYELNQKVKNYSKSQHLLRQNDFIMTIEDQGIEIWERNPK